ncbi:uncharacterized protein TNCV_3956531 [Trichonephila clavipes]|nr:uncharacterized protein TNCV_3956531 [Trichonephila clavipes]
MFAFNKARARARKIHQQRKRESWIKYVSNITCSTSSKEIWNKIRKLSGKYSASPVSMLVSNGVSVNTIPDIVNTLAETFAKTSSCDNYTTAFQASRREGEVKFFLFKRRRLQLPANTSIARVTQQQVQTGYTILCYGICPKVLSSPFSHCSITFGKPKFFPHSGVMPMFFRFQSLVEISLFDQSLRFHRHLKDLKIGSAKALNILKVLASTRWGADRTSLLRLYRALIRSKLDCGLQFCV